VCQVRSIQPLIDTNSLAEFAGSIGQMRTAISVLQHPIQTFHRLQGANQNGGGESFALGDNI
jgi:hypothetical protein